MPGAKKAISSNPTSDLSKSEFILTSSIKLKKSLYAVYWNDNWVIISLKGVLTCKLSRYNPAGDNLTLAVNSSSKKPLFSEQDRVSILPQIVSLSIMKLLILALMCEALIS